jgi:hypothetical protein
VGDREAREQEARDIRQEAAEAGLPAAWFMMHDVPTAEVEHEPDVIYVPMCAVCHGSVVLDDDTDRWVHSDD